VVIPEVTSLYDKFERELVNTPFDGFVFETLFVHETFTVGEADPDRHIRATNEIVNPEITLPVLFTNLQVQFPFDADPLPRNEILLFPYHPPVVPVV
jgi:hypothetical protein